MKRMVRGSGQTSGGDKEHGGGGSRKKHSSAGKDSTTTPGSTSDPNGIQTVVATTARNGQAANGNGPYTNGNSSGHWKLAKVILNPHTLYRRSSNMAKLNRDILYFYYVFRFLTRMTRPSLTVSSPRNFYSACSPTWT